MAMRRYSMYHSEAEKSYTLLEAGDEDLVDEGRNVLEADAVVVDTFVAPSWESAMELGNDFITGENHGKEEA